MSSSTMRWTLIGGGAAVFMLGLVFVAARSAAPPPALELRVPEAPSGDGVVKVYITGAVAQPGIYQLQRGDRYGDALAAAGGPTDDAEPLAVNMARRARDEDHIHVPRRGEAAAVVGTGVVVLDLNTATQAQLEALPGVGPVRAQKIVESRTKDGAFSRPEDLVQRKLIPQSMLEPLRDLILVRQ